MVNTTGANGINNGTRPSDEELEKALRKYALKGLKMELRLLYLKNDFGYEIKRDTLRLLNKKFNIPSVRKPPPYPLSKTIVCGKVAQDTNQRNGPSYIKREILTDGTLIPRDIVRKIMQEEFPEGAALRDPQARKTKKVRGWLTGNGVMEQVHADGHKKLDKLALRMGPNVGIPIYGFRDHLGKILHMVTVPNDRDELVIGHCYLDFVEANGYVIPRQMTVDGGTETGIMYGFQCSLRITYLPDLPEEETPSFRALKSTDNIPIESTWSYWLKAKGTTIRQVIAMGPANGWFIIGNSLHANLFQWLWPKIVQRHLDDFTVTFNDSPTRYQRDKKLPSGVSPNVVWDFPERYDLANLGCEVDPAAVKRLREDIGVSREEAFRWVSVEFDAAASQAYEAIGCPELVCDNGWAIFNRMVDILETQVV